MRRKKSMEKVVAYLRKHGLVSSMVSQTEIEKSKLHANKLVDIVNGVKQSNETMKQIQRWNSQYWMKSDA